MIGYGMHAQTLHQVLVVDTDEVRSTALGNWLKGYAPNYRIVGSVTTYKDSLKYLKRGKAHFIFYYMPLFSPEATKITRQLKHLYPSTSIVVLYQFLNPRQEQLLIRAGVSACLSQGADFDDILNLCLSIRILQNLDAKIHLKTTTLRSV